MFNNLRKKHIESFVKKEFKISPRFKITLRNLTQAQIENEFSKGLHFTFYIISQEIKLILNELKKQLKL